MQNKEGQTRAVSWADVSVGLAVIVLAAIVGWETSVIPTNAIYAQVGPKVIPWLATGMLAALGLLLTIEGLRGGWAQEEHGTFSPRGIGILLAGLVLNVALISTAGFIIASTVLFLCTTLAFGSTRIARDAGLGLGLAVVAFVGFDRVLGYKIGSGLIEAWL